MSDTQSPNKERHMPSLNRASSNLFSSNIAHQDQDILRPEQVLDKLTHLLGASNVQADPEKNEHYRMGWRSGGGSALAVLFPQTLLEIWRSLEICVEGDCIIIMQAAKTGLTEGSTPSGNDYDRPVVVINTLAMNQLYLVNDNEQVICLPVATLHQTSDERRLGKGSAF